MNQISQVTPTKSDNTLIIVLSILGVTGIAGFIIWKTLKKKSDTGGRQTGQSGQGGEQGGWGGQQTGGQQTGQSGGAAQNILDLISGIFKPRVGTPPIVANQTTTPTTPTTPNTTTTTTRPTTTNQTPASVPFRQAIVETKSGNLNIRNSPNGSQIGSLKKGTQILVRNSNVSGWLEYSKDGKNVSGYVSSTYVK
jgi:hypothetical protein